MTTSVKLLCITQFFKKLDTLSFVLLACIILYINGKQFKCSVFTFVKYMSAFEMYNGQYPFYPGGLLLIYQTRNNLVHTLKMTKMFLIIKSCVISYDTQVVFLLWY